MPKNARCSLEKSLRIERLPPATDVSRVDDALHRAGADRPGIASTSTPNALLFRTIGQIRRLHRPELDDRVPGASLHTAGTHDHTVAVEREVGRVEEEHLPDLRLDRVEPSEEIAERWSSAGTLAFSSTLSTFLISPTSWTISSSEMTRRWFRTFAMRTASVSPCVVRLNAYRLTPQPPCARPARDGPCRRARRSTSIDRPSRSPRRSAWDVPSRSSPASGPICRSRNSRRRWRAGATTASSSPAGATTSRSTRRSPIRLREVRPRPAGAARPRRVGLGAHLVGQAVCDPIDDRHRGILPPEIYGDGDPEGVRQRAAERMADTARAAAALGVQQVNGFTGSSVWHLLYVPAERLRRGRARLPGLRGALGPDPRRVRQRGRALRPRGAPRRSPTTS